MVCDFERENRRSEICVCDFCVYVCDCVWIYVCVCDFGLKNPKSKFLFRFSLKKKILFLILGWAGLVMRDGARGARGACGGGSGSREKNLFNKRVGFGPRVLACGSGPGMKKPGPNPTRCHSYILDLLIEEKKRSIFIFIIIIF